jgi:hypothetical protein
MNLKGFKYSNVQNNMHGGNKITHKVHIKNGKGYKSVTHFKIGKFIPGLFKDISKKTRRRLQ